MFVANCCKSPQIAKIATYAGFADPDFRSQYAPKKKIPDVLFRMVITVNSIKVDYLVYILTHLPLISYCFRSALDA